MRLICRALFALVLFAASAHATIDIPLRLDVPARTNVTHWPITVGVPFAQGAVKGVDDLCVVDDAGAPVACQFVVTGRWRDGSVRWALVDFHADLSRRYAIKQAARPAADDDIRIDASDAGVTVTTAGATYRFNKGEGCFSSVHLGDSALISGAGGAFYVIDSRDRRGVLQGDELKVEMAGTRHAVVRVAGEYRTADGTRNGAGTVYYHFYAGMPSVRISHKFIITDHTTDLWFKDIGMALPVAVGDGAVATFNHSHGDPSAFTTVPLAGADEAIMLQSDFPHFGSTSSNHEIRAAGRRIAAGRAGGDWCDLSSPTLGLSAQLPGFAEMFPKAFLVAANRMTVKFWAPESGKVLDFRTRQITESYFGHDWIPADHKTMDSANTAIGTARTHDIWLSPRKNPPAGPASPSMLNKLGATRDEIYAVVDPAWVSASGVMDRFQPYNPSPTDTYARAEEVVRSFYLQHVQIPEQIFPNTGYISWGRNPYVSQGWQVKNGAWYPTPHRLGRCLEYNLKRCVWILYARSGDRLYRDYARRYTRFLHDFVNSNWDSPVKPLGWYVQGSPWDSPAFWGSFSEQDIRRTERPNFISEVSTLGYGTSEDVIQYVYDYFMAGDFHSRDMAITYKRAVELEIGDNVDKLLTAVPSYVILRPMGSAYEIEPDDKFYDLGHRFLERITGDAANGLNLAQPQNYVKDGEIWAGFYHYYTSTGDELALKPVVMSAQHYYRTNRIDFVYRGSAQFQCFAVAYDQTKDPAYLAYMKQALRDFTHTTPTLHDRGLNYHEIDRRFTDKWGHVGAITTASPVMIGIPVALRAIADNDEPTPRVPMASKPQPTAKTHLLFKKEQPQPGRIDLYVNNFGDLEVTPRVLDMRGTVVPTKVVAREFHRTDKPHGDAAWQHFHNYLRGLSGDHLFVQLEVDAPEGVYQLDAGDETAWKVLYSDMNKFMQVAPDGMILEQNHDYFFRIPAGLNHVELFAHRPIEVFDPVGNPVELVSQGNGMYRFATGGKAGVWRMTGSSDKLVADYPFTKITTFVRFMNLPLAVGLDDVSRAFDADIAALKPAIVATKVEGPHAEGRFGKAAALGRDQVIHVPVDETKAPAGAGTIEFWVKPTWSSTDLHMLEARFSRVTQHWFRMGPMLISHNVLPVNEGRYGDYNLSQLDLTVFKTKGGIKYPVRLFLREGQWYHVAVTWSIDGRQSDVEVFINGRRKVYDHYQGAIPFDLKTEDLAAFGNVVKFGSAVSYGYADGPGVARQIFDEVRVSNVVRYTDHFKPPTAPFAADANTYLLMHLDGTLEAAGFGVAGEATSAKESKFQ